MAVLNKIRQRSVFLIIVIAMALFAFVLADVIRNGGATSQTAQNTIATVNGEDIGRAEFARQVEAYQRNAGPNANTIEIVRGVWDEKLREVILEEEFEELGIRAEDAQVRRGLQAQLANNPNFTNEMGIFDNNRLREYVASIRATSPEAYQQWVEFENSVARNAVENIYFDMVRAGIGATLTEAEYAYRMENDNIDLEFVQIPYTSVPDDEIDVSKNEIRDYVKNHPSRFETEEARDIRYVFVEEEASAEDKAEARENLTALLEDRVEYNSVTNTNDTLRGFNKVGNHGNFVNNNSDLPFEDRFIFKRELAREFSDDIFTMEEGETFGPYEHNGYWKVTKILETKEIPDTSKASHILIAYEGLDFAPDVSRSKEEAKQLADSIANVVRRDIEKFDTMASQYSADESNKNEGGSLGSFGPGDMVPEFENFVFENDEGDIGVVETDFGYHVISIDEQSERKKAVKVATLAREITPSESSLNNLFNEVTKFELAARDGDFENAAKEYNYDVRTVKDLEKLDQNIPGVGDQRRIVQWAFEDDVKAGNVRRFELSNGYVVAQVTAVKEKGLMTAEDASSIVLPILEREKKAAVIKKKISGNSLQEIAQNQNVQAQNASSVNLQNPTLPGAGREPKVVGAGFGLEEGEVSEPITGDKGVYVIQLKNLNRSEGRESYQNIAQQETSARRQDATNRVLEALREKAEIEDYRAKFY